MYVILVMLRNISLISEFCSENHIDNNQNTSLAAKGALAHHLQRRTACKTSPPAESKMAIISQTLGYWTPQTTFAK